MQTPDWLDRLHAEQPQSKVIAQWLLEALEGRDLRTLTHRECVQAQVLTSTLFHLVDKIHQTQEDNRND